jgi:hypothetical protein
VRRVVNGMQSALHVKIRSKKHISILPNVFRPINLSGGIVLARDEKLRPMPFCEEFAPMYVVEGKILKGDAGEREP